MQGKDSQKKESRNKKRYDRIEQITDNRFLNLYHIYARSVSGQPFDYFAASRNDREHLKHQTHSMQPEGMAVYALRKDNPEQIVLIRQYRYPLDAYIYELPAGLIEAGESAGEAAIREMKEETGLDFTVYEGGRDYYRRPFFLAPGMTDESGSLVYGYASGVPGREGQEDSEDIEILFADKEKVRCILQNERVTIRAAFLLMQFLQADPSDPFHFLTV